LKEHTGKSLKRELMFDYSSIISMRKDIGGMNFRNAFKEIGIVANLYELNLDTYPVLKDMLM
jgi:hypothetical protein